jgi:glycosyltransferase involved in cell wall biosynthesis
MHPVNATTSSPAHDSSQNGPRLVPVARDAPAGRRVMHVVLSLDPGGTERLVIDIVKGLAPAVESIVCCLDRPGAWAPELTRIGVPVLTLRRQPGFHPGLGRRIARLAASHGVSVLHCHQYTPFVYGQLGAVLAPSLRVVFTEHGRLSDAGPSFKRRVLNPVLGRLPDAIFAVSQDLRSYMVGEGLPASHVKVIHNGIDAGPPPSAAARLEARRALGLPSDACVIGTAGRLDPVKDLATVIDAFAALRRRHPDMRLVIIGDGPERSRLEAHAAARDLAAAIVFTGYRRDARALMPALDVYVNSSVQEGVSLTILEAMAAAIPVVATRVGGTPEVVLDDETGVLVPPRSPGRLCAAVERLMAAPERRRLLGDAARFRVKRSFSTRAMIAAYASAYFGT